MVVVLRPGSSPEEVAQVAQTIRELGFSAHVSEGLERTVVGVVGSASGRDEVMQALLALEAVERVVPVGAPYKLASRAHHADRTRVRVSADCVFGGDAFTVIAGPCSVESEEQIVATALAVRASGASALRGGAYKPRTSPYSFQGLQQDGLQYLAAAREASGLAIVTELLDPRHLETVDRYADMFQIGARNMQNFELLKEVGRSRKPVLLKRGMSATIEEWLMAAEYVLSEGNDQVVLCERGIRTFEQATRSTLDLSAVAVAQQLSHLPVIVDPSQAAGRAALVAPLSRAACALGADGLIVEVHPDPPHARSDAQQQLRFDQFAEMMRDVQHIAEMLHRLPR
ncbi:MAG: 3-deoxy-7-phosphoheptulonate synthase [Thermaerobacter sp.]|nr:3-deoxy-7-phosphoheptulonate synthase [Thermaerobacter sp.]